MPCTEDCSRSMSTSDLTRTWCEIETLVEGIAPLIQEVLQVEQHGLFCCWPCGMLAALGGKFR